MPANELMTWNKEQKRWFKKYRGRMYSVSPRQLGTSRTRQESRTAANSWWEQKQAELDALPPEARHPRHIVDHYRVAAENHRIFAKWHRQHGNIDLAEKSEAHLEWLEQALKSDGPPFPLSKWQEDPLWEERFDDAIDLVWMDRFSQLRREETRHQPVPVEKTIRGHVDQYLKTLQVQRKQGKITLGTYETIYHRLQVFHNWIGPDVPLEDLNELTFQNFFLFVADEVVSNRMAAETAKPVLANVKRFIRSRWALRLIDLPRNLDSRDLTVASQLQAVEVLATEEVAHFLTASSERLRLYLLLMLNCGMYTSDIGALRHDEVDLKHGTLSRKRTKTRNRSESVPMVCYLLWDETLRLLKEHVSQHPALCLLNEDGGALWAERVQEQGKYTRNDTIKNLWFRFQSNMLKLPRNDRKPLKLFRKTAASMLEHHDTFGRYAQFYLGHSPRSVAERHYVQPSQRQFDRAIVWLGKQFGFKTTLKRG